MSLLKDKLAQQIPGLRDDIKNFVKAHGDKQLSTVSIAQAYGGMRGVKAMVCDTSEVPPDKGLLIRNIPIGELADRLPEEIFFLLCTGDLPNKEELADLQKEYSARCEVPDYVWKVLEAMPKDSHPMCMFDTAILVMEKESKFRAGYDKGMKKTEYWEPMLEDSLDILAKLPNIGAGIYRMRFDKGPRIAPKKDLDWGANFAYMLGLDDPKGTLADLMRLYLTLHSDHEGGNVSAHTCHCVASALSDAYYAVSAGLNGLAGPLHGLANQECLNWVLQVHEKFGGVPSDDELKKFAWDTLNAGKVIPGYGHAVLRVTDPRYTAFRAFGQKHMADDPIFAIVNKVYEIVPGVLKEHGKAKNPWPNVDAGSGSLLYHYGMKEFPYYTVLFSISRAMGMCSQMIVSRAMGYAIERPKSLPTAVIKALAGA
ncbi:MAG: citrate (Si)-synthase [candidate division Zixibacteria bacterium]|nr:citrate (Si)-synthase [candidate division Zixibacteria bacterium]